MDRNTDNPDYPERQVIATNGSVFFVSLQGAIRIVTSPSYFWVMVSFSVVVALFNTPMFGLEITLPGRFFYWFLDCVIVTAIWIALFWLVVQTEKRIGIALPFYSPVVCAVGVAGMIWFNYGLERFYFGMPALGGWAIWSEGLRYFLIAIVFELLTVVFILPYFPQVRFEKVTWGRSAGDWPEPVGEGQGGAVADSTLDKQQNDGVMPRALSLSGGKAIPLDGLMFMKSVEHYVEFVYPDRREMERATLRNLVDQIAPEAGMQTHRSYWVSRDAVAGLNRKNGNLSLVLSDDTEIPIARNRRAMVRDWLNGQTAELQS